MKYLPLGSPGREPRTGSSCLVAGWGLTEKKKDSDVLLSANVTVVDRKTCSKSYRSKITKEMICAGSEKADTCQVGCVQHVSHLPQLCSCEPTCVSVPHRATQEGPSCAKKPWSGSLPLVVKVVRGPECTLTSLRNISPGSRRSSEPLKWRNELLLLSETLTETQNFCFADGIKSSSFLSLQVCAASSGIRHLQGVCCCLMM